MSGPAGPAPSWSRVIVPDPKTEVFRAGDWRGGRIVRIAPGVPTSFADVPSAFGHAALTLPGSR